MEKRRTWIMFSVPSLRVWQLQWAAVGFPWSSSLCQISPGAYCSSSPSSSLCAPSQARLDPACPETWCATSLAGEAPGQIWIKDIMIIVQSNSFLVCAPDVALSIIYWTGRQDKSDLSSHGNEKISKCTWLILIQSSKAKHIIKNPFRFQMKIKSLYSANYKADFFK